jgi:HEAT repeat protein
MTEDTSPENLRKFLESDDPAMVIMGLSMAKGSGVTEELLPTILRLYMWDDDKNIRATARAIFFKYAPDELKEKVKENWKNSYRTLSITGDKFLEILKVFESLDDIAEIFWRRVEPLTKVLVGKTTVDRWGKTVDRGKRSARLNAAEALGKIGNERAVEALIKAVEDDPDDVVQWIAIEALGKIGDTRAVEPLIEALEKWDMTKRMAAAEALGKIGDTRAVEPLIKVLSDSNQDVRKSAVGALEKLGHKVDE